ncbi:2OG-Fe(II) oxygenase [Teredinibacter purpureus]|uniref:2OG-Fe(II) oxygenase n=1 Tax=Teredinibacter purpureus TaxID=2731756 RepID=UPI0005F89060|nr:2OG-Fe(II) oxygenase [Teredinibacter purpureus]
MSIVENLCNFAETSLANGPYATFAAENLFDQADLSYMETSCNALPKERIEIGDVGELNYLDVGRFMEDKKGELPVYRNDPIGQNVVKILTSGKCKELFEHLMGGEYFIRRCQSNILIEGSHIGRHIDTYSNFKYKYSVVIQFGEDYDGGSFFVEHEGKDLEIKTGYHDILINKCEIPHGVNTVTGGRRSSLVFFVSQSPLDERNLENNQI